MRTIINAHQFLSLSASINYQLSASPINWRAVLALAVGNRLDEAENEMILEALHYLGEAYGQTKRRLGPYAIIHPIRAMALLSRAVEKFTLLDLLTILFHDKQEDITADRYPADAWRSLEAHYAALIRRLKPEDEWFLNERLEVLAIQPGEKYYNYLGRMLERAHKTPELVRIKLADRLDNTLDLRMDLYSDKADIECYEMIFALLFTETRARFCVRPPHPVPGKINGARRLYQMFKNAVFLSLLRDAGLDRIDTACERLFATIARTSLSEAQRILQHIFMYHLQEMQDQRAILLDVMTYCQQGAVTRVTPTSAAHRLDGLFKYRFDHENKETRNRSLDELYQDKPLMAESALAFMAVFSSFLMDPDFKIRGIDAAGIHPDSAGPSA
ncbi:MAG TPA: hypothetical protein PK176_12250 [Acidobacteriota bacterium]|nr:hypothetical protein [Acidobacteriota bacterium]HQM64075.1 hypothetical protein [Acidobacteriota bacterium]